MLVPPASAATTDGLTNPGLGAVVALSPTDAWAVGANNEGAQEIVLIEHWDGAVWTTVHLPNIHGGLYAIAAVDASDVWAVGYSNPSGSLPFLTLTMHWDGTSWSQVSSPNLGSNPVDILYGVSARKTDDVWAVGEVLTQRAQSQPIAIHWDGTAWSTIERVGRPSSPVDALEGVTTPSAHGALAVGYCQKTDPKCPAGSDHSAVYTRDHGVWSLVTTRNLGMLYSATATGSTDIWAAGGRGLSHSDGTTWKHVTGAITGQVVSVVALTPNLAMAVGGNSAEAWDGSTWRQVSTPAVGSLASVSLDSATDGWAVGVDDGGSLLFEHWDGTRFTQQASG